MWQPLVFEHINQVFTQTDAHSPSQGCPGLLATPADTKQPPRSHRSIGLSPAAPTDSVPAPGGTGGFPRCSDLLHETDQQGREPRPRGPQAGQPCRDSAPQGQCIVMASMAPSAGCAATGLSHALLLFFCPTCGEAESAGQAACLSLRAQDTGAEHLGVQP